jgi:hypothetical protein
MPIDWQTEEEDQRKEASSATFTTNQPAAMAQQSKYCNVTDGNKCSQMVDVALKF